jgi:hypothetical protein
MARQIYGAIYKHVDIELSEPELRGLCYAIAVANLAEREMQWWMRAYELKFKPVYDDWLKTTNECKQYIHETFAELQVGFTSGCIFNESDV